MVVGQHFGFNCINKKEEMKSTRVYYAHTVGIYNTEQEERDVFTLGSGLGLTVVNPNNDRTQQLFQQLRENDYMNAFKVVFFTMIEGCDVFAFRPLPDGRIPSGIAAELEHAEKIGLPIIELPCNIEGRKIGVEETREYLHQSGNR